MSPLATLAALSSPVSRCVVFSVAGHPLALPAEAVRRFLPLPRLDRLPTAPRPVAGVFRYHGEIVPVLHLSALLDLESASETIGLYAPLMMITWRGRPLALLVDQVQGNVAVAAEGMLPAEPSLSFNGCAVAGFADSGKGGTVALLDPDRLLNAAEGRLLDAFRDAEERRLGLWSPESARGTGS